MRSQHISTVAVHGNGHKENLHADITSPIHLSTTFERKHDGTQNDYIYTRAGNPNRDAVEAKLAAIEAAKTAITFSSGLAAMNALLENVLQPGDHVILPDDTYHGTRSLVADFFARWQITFDEVDMPNAAALKDRINNNTRLILTETPSNPQLKITDLEAVVSLAKEHNIITACDNTFATPLLQQPLKLGIDFVIYSSTKFFSGHSDILGGVITTNHDNDLSNRLRAYQHTAGAVPSPFDCWLLARSLSTLPLRFAAQCSNATRLAVFLNDHPAIEKVYYPGLSTHINHEIAKRQMNNGFGSIVTVLIKGGKEDAMQFASRLKLFKHATSLGGVESLVEHRRSSEGNHAVSPDNLMRISLGIEYYEDLQEDIKQALETL